MLHGAETLTLVTHTRWRPHSLLMQSSSRLFHFHVHHSSHLCHNVSQRDRNRNQSTGDKLPPGSPVIHSFIDVVRVDELKR
ncbi:unnamed protein product [Timema podura]|uniref:Uncharacterized protein n=1 Tax=Timema podura TaxID=61482 RepID=A0ABN7NJW2_TIMPD|nr:unnamed protein product [Timema podura]